jgi:acyl carrier protein
LASSQSEASITPRVDPFVPEEMMREVVEIVLEVQTDPTTERGILGVAADHDLSGYRLEDLGLNSLLMAEVIVEVEQRLDTLLELVVETPLQTLADLRQALRPVHPV